MSDLGVRLEGLHAGGAFEVEGATLGVSCAPVVLAKQDERLSVERVERDDLFQGLGFLFAGAARGSKEHTHREELLAISVGEAGAHERFDAIDELLALVMGTLRG